MQFSRSTIICCVTYLTTAATEGNRLSSWEVSTVALLQHDEFLKNAHVFQFCEFSALPSTGANSHWVLAEGAIYFQHLWV